MESLQLPPLLTIPPEIQLQLALRLDYPDIINFCQGSQQFNQLICQNPYFWHQLVERDFGKVSRSSDLDWRQFYLRLLMTRVWALGDNYLNKLGLPDRSLVTLTPTLVPFPSKVRITSIAMGSQHTLFLDTRNNLWVAGSNSAGQLGLPGVIWSELTRVPDISAKKIAAGSNHSVIINLAGFAYDSGQGRTETFQPITDYPAIDVAAGEKFTLVIDQDHQVHSLGSVPDLGKIRAKRVFARQKNLAVIDLDDRLWVAGLNFNGSLGVGDDRPVEELRLTQHRAKKIALGEGHSLMIDVDDHLWVTGDNRFGALGLDQLEFYNTFTYFGDLLVADVAVGKGHSLVVLKDTNQLVVFGENNWNRLDKLLAYQVFANDDANLIIGYISTSMT